MIDHAAGNRRPNSAPRDARAAEEQREKDEKSTAWAFVWTLFAFKIATLAAILWAAEGSGEATLVVAATNWFWLLIPAVAIAGPLAFHYRMRRVRRRRAAMLRAEWMID